MAIVEMVMPKMGESVMEGTILGWLKEVGESIEQDEAVLEVATDKVDTEVPAPYSGVLKERLVAEGDVVEVGKPIAKIETEEEVAEADMLIEETPEAETEMAEEPAPVLAALSASGPEGEANNGFYSPLVMNIARQEGMPTAELANISGTGKDSRLTKKDIMAYIAQRKTSGVTTQATVAKPMQQQVASPSGPAPVNAPTTTKATSALSMNGQDEILEMDRMRKVIAERMVESKRTSPHVTSFVEADLTRVVQWRNQHKNAFKQNYGGSLTFTPIFVEAIAKAIRDFPMINISVDGQRIIKKKHINVGMAVALPTGNLIVPVINDADHLNLIGLTLKVNDLAQRARDNKLKPDELSGGTYTISNVGTFGNVLGTPIIMQPQVAIMAFGAIVKKPAVIETPEGDVIGIRHKMFLSHSYDHRVVDGALGGMFVRKVADYLESFDIEQTV